MRNNLSFLVLVIQIVSQNVIRTTYTEAETDFFQRSVFRALIERGGQFQARMNATVTIYPKYQKRPYNYDYEEKFDFGTKSGEFEEQHSSDEPERPSFRCLYLDGKEVYRFSEETRHCKSFALNQRTFKYELPRWGLDRIFNRSHTYSILGPSVLLEILYKNYDVDKKRVKCEALSSYSNRETGENRRRCSITFNDTVRLNYSFVDRADDHEYSMYPEKIEGYEHVLGVWKSWAEISYLNFSPLFTNESIIDRDLPIGFGCRRVRSQNYPQMRTNYGDRFELEFDVELKYVPVDGQLGERSAKLEYRTRNYTGKMHVDLNNSMNVAEAIDEITNASLRTFYNTRSHVMHQVNLETNNCTAYNLTSNESINWFYLQDSWVKIPALYHADTSGSFLKSYSFLREYRLGDLPCLVFERKFDFWTTRSAGNPEYETNKKSVTSRLNANQIIANDFLCSTHYYPKNSSYWSADDRQFSVPKRIEFTIFNDPVYSHGAINFLTINIRSFKPNPSEQPKYNVSECIDMDF